jgi:hypothetical protein
MLSAFLRLFALRPILAGSLLGIPILTLILLGLLFSIILKVLLFVVIPLTLAWWLVKALRKPSAPAAEPVQTL